MAFQRAHERLLEPCVNLGEARAEWGPAHDVRPELEEHRQPAVVPSAPPRGGQGDRVESESGGAGGDDRKYRRYLRSS